MATDKTKTLILTFVVFSSLGCFDFELDDKEPSGSSDLDTLSDNIGVADGDTDSASSPLPDSENVGPGDSATDSEPDDDTESDNPIDTVPDAGTDTGDSDTEPLPETKYEYRCNPENQCGGRAEMRACNGDLCDDYVEVENCDKNQMCLSSSNSAQCITCAHGCKDNQCNQCNPDMGNPCCSSNGKFKGPSDGSCGQTIEYRCLDNVCGSNRQHRVVYTFCSGSSAKCDGDKDTPIWTPMPDCDHNEICDLNEQNVATCYSCGEYESCDEGSCSCEFEACHGVCCTVDQVCRWSESCGLAETKVLLADGSAESRIGTIVSISGNTAVIGVPNRDKLIFFERNASGVWKKSQEYESVNCGGCGEQFGRSVSISGNNTITGLLPEWDGGYVYIIQRTSSGLWNVYHELTGNNDGFGEAVSISDSAAVVGAPYNHQKGVDSGAAYVFEGKGVWKQTAVLFSSDTLSLNFGLSVSIAGGYAIVASKGHSYIFEQNSQNNWTERAKLRPSSVSKNSFGKSVSIDGNVAIVGFPLDDENGTESGSAYVFERNAFGDWPQKSKLLPLDGSARAHFGCSVSLSGDYAVIGAFREDGNGEQSGSAYIFKHNALGNWVQTDKLLPDGVHTGDNFGESVSISGDALVIGAPGDDDMAINAGAIYIF